MNEAEIKELDAARLEILNLLIVFYIYRWTCSGRVFPEDTRFGLYAYFVYIRALEHDLVLRLCRLDEDDRTKHSLREVLKSARTTIGEANAHRADKLLKQYRQAINPLKVKRRNYYLAHLAKGAEEQLDPQGGIGPQVQLAVEILDVLSGSRVGYSLRASSTDAVIDLRQAFSI